MGGSAWRERTLRDRLEAYATLPGAVSRDRARREVASASCLSSSLHGRIHLARTHAQRQAGSLCYATLPGAVSRDRARREVASASCWSSSLHGRIHLARTRAQTGWKPMLRCRARYHATGRAAKSIPASCLSSSLHGRIHLARTHAQRQAGSLCYAAGRGITRQGAPRSSISILLVFFVAWADPPGANARSDRLEAYATLPSKRHR